VKGQLRQARFLQHFPEDRLLDALAAIHTISRYLRSRLRVIWMIQHQQLQTSRGIPDDGCVIRRMTNLTQRPQPNLDQLHHSRDDLEISFIALAPGVMALNQGHHCELRSPGREGC
jgi:hypothetical protein